MNTTPFHRDDRQQRLHEVVKEETVTVEVLPNGSINSKNAAKLVRFDHSPFGSWKKYGKGPRSTQIGPRQDCLMLVEDLKEWMNTDEYKRERELHGLPDADIRFMHKPPARDYNGFMSGEEVAYYCGASLKTLIKLSKDGNFPKYKTITRGEKEHYYFRKKDIDNHLLKNFTDHKKPAVDIKQLVDSGELSDSDFEPPRIRVIQDPRSGGGRKPVRESGVTKAVSVPRKKGMPPF